MDKGCMRLFLSFVLMCFCLSVNAEDLQKIDYKNLKDGAKISFDGINWSKKIDKKSGNYYIKKIAKGTKYSEFYAPDGVFLFSTGSHYDFINKGTLIGYSNVDMAFYEYIIKDGILESRKLGADEVEALFPKYKVIKISDFSSSTNSLKIKKGFKDLKVLILNDTENSYDNYAYTTNNADFNQYELKGFLKINKVGMIHFSSTSDDSKNKPWYVLLIRK